jgi:hypothetical protein
MTRVVVPCLAVAVEAERNCVVEITRPAFFLGHNVVDLNVDASIPVAYATMAGCQHQRLLADIPCEGHSRFIIGSEWGVIKSLASNPLASNLVAQIQTASVRTSVTATR